MGKTIADQYDDHSFMVLGIHSSVIDIYCFRKDSASNIRVTNQFNNISVPKDDVSFSLLDNGKAQSWWKSVFFEEDGEIQYDGYYDSFKVTDGCDLVFGAFLETITASLGHIIKKVAKFRFDAIYIPEEFFLNLPFRYVFQLRICKTVRVLPKIHLTTNERQYVLQRWNSNTVPVLSIAGGIPVSQLLGDNRIVVHVPLDDESLSCPLLESKTWRDVLVTTDFSYRTKNMAFQVVILDAQVDVFSNLFLSLSNGMWERSFLIDTSH